MEVSIIRIPDGLSNWDLVGKYMRLRREVFINRLEWPLYQLDDMEFEQYDTVHSVYAIAHECGEVRGGARLLRTSQTIGSGKFTYSYMIRDACRNLLPGLPQDLCFNDPPVDRNIWELTRLVSRNTPMVAAKIMAATNQFLKEQDASCCLFLARPSFMRMAARMGYRPVPMGGVKKNQDGSFLAFGCDVTG